MTMFFLGFLTATTLITIVLGAAGYRAYKNNKAREGKATPDDVRQ